MQRHTRMPRSIFLVHVGLTSKCPSCDPNGFIVWLNPGKHRPLKVSKHPRLGKSFGVRQTDQPDKAPSADLETKVLSPRRLQGFEVLSSLHDARHPCLKIAGFPLWAFHWFVLKVHVLVKTNCSSYFGCDQAVLQV